MREPASNKMKAELRKWLNADPERLKNVAHVRNALLSLKDTLPKYRQKLNHESKLRQSGNYLYGI